MANDSNQKGLYDQRAGPRASVGLDVDVEVAGKKRRMRLVSKDIGAGGIFLRTDKPASLWSKVKLSLELPDGGNFEVSGEVVRSVSLEKASTTGHPPGMAVAFDEVSRSKRKELVALVLDLCSQRSRRDPQTVRDKPAAKLPTTQGTRTVETNQDSADELLEEIDELLESVDVDMQEDIYIEVDEFVDSETSATSGQEPTQPETSRREPGSVEKLHRFLVEYQRTRSGDTYYHVLGIAFDASTEEIERAYQGLLDRLRPPKSPEVLPPDIRRELSIVLGKVRKAFAILSKPDRRRAYDFLIDSQTDKSQ